MHFCRRGFIPRRGSDAGRKSEVRRVKRKNLRKKEKMGKARAEAAASGVNEPVETG
jgi:hypothetical protein